MKAKTISGMKRRGGLLFAVMVLTFSVGAAAQDFALIPVRTNAAATITAQRGGTPIGNTITAEADAVDTLRIPMSQLTSITQLGLRAQNTPAITYTRGTVTLNLPGNPAYRTADISIYSLDGRRVMRAGADAIHSASGISRQSLAAGVYMIKVRCADRSQTNAFRFSHRGGKFNISVSFTGGTRNLRSVNAANASAAGDITITVEPSAASVTAGYQSRVVHFRPEVKTHRLQTINMSSTPGLGTPVTPDARTEAVRQAHTNTPPSSVTAMNTYGTNRTVTYQSRRFGGTQTAVVVLPPNHDDGRLFPVMYFGHGITGSARADDMSSRRILGNLAASGEAKDMIIVYTNQWTPTTQAEVDAGNTMQAANVYTLFIDEWAANLHPYILENFPVAPGRENVAITGFSMGGNMAIRIWMAHPDKIGFVGLGDPPAISTSSSDIGRSNAAAANAPKPWLILITNADPDISFVGNMPKNISDALTARQFDHIWHLVPGSDHNQTVMTPHLYNFLRGIF